MKCCVFYISCIITILLSSCKEPFPVYEEPKDVLRASMIRLSGDTLYNIQNDSGAVLESDNFHVNILVKNVYPQLLQGDALISGRLNFFVTSPAPKIGLPYSITRDNLTQPAVFHNSIALTPNQSAELRIYFSPNVYGGIFSGLPFNEVMLADSTRILTYAPMTITVTASVQIFQRVQAINVPDLSFKQIFVYMVVKSKKR